MYQGLLSAPYSFFEKNKIQKPLKNLMIGPGQSTNDEK